MKCPKCNEDLEEGMKFCTKCGANIEEALKEKEELEKKKAKEQEEKNKIEEEEKLKEQKNQEIVENKEKSEQEKIEVNNEPKEYKNNDKVDPADSKNEKSKKKSKKKVFIIIVIIILLLAGLGVGAWWYLSNNQVEESEDKVLEWGDVYLEVLNDTDKLEDMDNQKIQLCDLDKDSIPELIIYGIKNASEYIANIYKLNDKNEVDTIRVSLDNEFDLRLVYDAYKDDYIWYAVSKKDNDTKVYNLNIENGEYNSEEVDLNFGSDSLEIEDNYSGKIDFDKNASEDDKKNMLEQATDEYVSNDEMITDEVKDDVENIKILHNVKKLDSSKDVVYSAVSKKINGNSYKYPCINIDSEDVKKMNDEIKKEYGFPSSINSTNYIDHIGLEIEEISYSYVINENILSVLVWEGGNESIWANTYNVDLSTLSKIDAAALIEKYSFSKDEVIEKSLEAVNSEFDNMIKQEKEMTNWETLYGDKYVKEWKAEIKPYIEELNVFVNEKNELCILGKYTHGGGQWSCTQTVVINISNGYKVSELEFDKGPITHYIIDSYIPNQPDEEEKKEEEKEENKTEEKKENNTSNSGSTTVAEGTYNRGDTGNIKISNSKKGQFDFNIYCEYMTSAGYPNMGSLQGVAKEISKGVFEYSESKEQNKVEDYKITFKVSDGKIVIEESQPYYAAGNNVTFNGTFEK